MAQSDSRRLGAVMAYLYPELNCRLTSNGEFRPDLCDYYLENNSDGMGTQLVWQRDDIPEPTDQELADAKEAALNAEWWRALRWKRDELLQKSDWSQGEDIPSSLKTSYATYRVELRDLPTTVTKPSFETLNNQSFGEWNIDALMPSKP